jgi:hypothetical protein
MNRNKTKKPSAAKTKVRNPQLTSLSQSAVEARSMFALRGLTESILNPEYDDRIESQIESAYSWPFKVMAKESAPIPEGEADKNAAVLNLFHSNDVLGVSDGTSKASPPAWYPQLVCRALGRCVGTLSPFVIPSGTAVSEDVLKVQRRFLVITTDPESEDSATLKWLASQFSMKLRAVTSCLAGLHGWFDPVEPELEAQLARYLPFYGLCSEESFEATQRLMLPGSAPYVKLMYLAR